VLELLVVQAEYICLCEEGVHKPRLRRQRDALLGCLAPWQREQLRYVALSLETMIERPCAAHQSLPPVGDPRVAGLSGRIAGALGRLLRAGPVAGGQQVDAKWWPSSQGRRRADPECA
jgi:hypothetical protein